MPKDMTDTVYLVADVNGVRRMTKSEPTTKAGERTFRIRVTAPRALFREPTIDAQITVGEQHVLAPSGDVEVLEPPHLGTLRGPDLNPEGDGELDEEPDGREEYPGGATGVVGR